MVDIIPYVKQFIDKKYGAVVMPYSRSHYYMMQLSKFQNQLRDTVPNYVAFFDAQAASGPNFTILKDGIPMIAGGFVPLWPGVFEGWLLRDERVSPYWVSLGRCSKLIFSGLSSVMELHRVQFHVHSLDTRAIKYAKFLMFQEEGTLTNYGADKADYLMMRRLY